MPLRPPASREPIHSRAIQIDGYRREDGLFDIEATLADTKSYAFNRYDGTTLQPGDRLHGMAMRLTIDLDVRIMAVEAAMDDTPYDTCPGAVPQLDRLVGLRIGRGFVREVAERIGGAQGCTHLRELLAQMATVAFQTLGPLKAGAGDTTVVARLSCTCFAYAPDGPVVRRRFPGHASAADKGAATASSDLPSASTPISASTSPAAAISPAARK
jgi:hypothetical protein